MAWDFETEPEFQRELDWMDRFVREEVEPIDHVLRNPYDPNDPLTRALLPPRKEQVKERGLWACHLGPELGGPGFGQLKLALMNEILGRSRYAPIVFGCQAPDTGNAEILAHYGSPSQKKRYLEPLMNGDIVSCYSMTEPHAGADPTLFTTRAVRDGDEWVINGEKWFSSNARWASFLIVMCVTDPDVSPYEGMSMLIVPTDTPGVEIVRNVGVGLEGEEHWGHAHIRYTDVRVPADHMLGKPGSAFVIAQTRLGGGRIHHAMRTVAQVRKAFDLLCERALSREVRAGRLADLQMTQEKIADSWIDLEQFRLLVLRTAWKIDKYNDYRKVRGDIAAIKVLTPRVLHDVTSRALQLHGAIGVSNDMPFVSMLISAYSLGIADGPSEVHKITLAKQILRDRRAHEGLYPSGHLPSLEAAARERFADLLEAEIGNL
ncbi:MAG: acyl-CoA dehydrogenase family protein [Spirochaetaceae bacterium]|nr:acyl-CoA dehydrogenase family protein [Myxococcales bacterium]MCB9722677.1 acyl-CoA dehydrogenase family protein [Spirochaetaceae bacterium]